MSKKDLLLKSASALAVLAVVISAFIYMNSGPELIGEDESNEMYDGAELAAEFEVLKTRDPALGRVPRERLMPAIDKTLRSKADAANLTRFARRGARVEGDVASTTESTDAPSALTWTERGPDRDSTGVSNGNTRANSGITAGRIRAFAVDPNDLTGKTVLVGGVDGGIWRTTDITAAPPTWTLLNDFMSNMAIADIAYDPRPGFQNIAYAATGESYFNADAVRGNGVFKSTDGGVTWAWLTSTSSFLTGTRIVVDNSGNVYLATRDNGLRRSIDGGSTWSGNISPSGLSASVCDLELSSTGRLHIVTGIFSAQGYRFTDAPATVTSAAGWTAPTTTFVNGQAMRAEIDVAGDTLYAAPANSSYQVPTVFKSTDGGANWAATITQPASGSWANGQGWYSLAVGVNPTNPLEVIVGGLDTYRSIDGGITWFKISAWVGTSGQYVHADIHNIQFWDGGNKLLIASDGGVFYSTDKGTTFRDRNTGLRLKQFYSVAVHPTTTNYFLAGAQDNGTHLLTTAGLGPSVEVTGGDGAFTAIDQDQPQYQFGAYVYNNYRRSVDGGNTWSQVNFGNTGQFINSFEYDNTANILYGSDNSGTFRRWLNPQTGSTSAVLTVSGMSGKPSALSVSPYTPNRLFIGTEGGQVWRIDSANTVASPIVATNLSGGMPGGYVSNIGFGTTENNVIASVANYGLSSVMVSVNGGTTWTANDGNLPDMPVRWAMFRPDDNTKAIIGTETGVWTTNLLNGAATQWVAEPGFPTVRVDMLRYRPSDRLLVAATHGRGIWSATIPAAVSTAWISGRVYATSTGRGLKNAAVHVSSSDGSSRTVRTGPLGLFQINDLPTGRTYVISIQSRRFTYTPQTIVLEGNVGDVGFVPN